MIDQKENRNDDTAYTKPNPDGLFELDGFSQVVVASGSKTIYISGQGAYDKQMKLLGKEDYFAQTVKAFGNLKIALAAAGATPAQVVSSTMYVKNLSTQVMETFIHAMNVAQDGEPFAPNASSLIGVQALGGEDMLVEISAIAVVD